MAEKKQTKKEKVSEVKTEEKDTSKKPEKKSSKQVSEAKKVTTGKKVTPRRKKEKKNVPEARAYIHASFNNTIVTITDLDGNVLASSSPGAIGFVGTKKSTAFAATKAAEDVAYKAQKFGVREAKVFIKGPGPGRNAAVKGLDSAGLRITLLSDVTPLPHNGCRPRKMPRK